MIIKHSGKSVTGDIWNLIEFDAGKNSIRKTTMVAKISFGQICMRVAFTLDSLV